MADHQRNYQDHRRGDRGRHFDDDGYARPQNFGDFRMRGQDSEPWEPSEGHSFGGQRTYARDLYSDSGYRRHETEWQSGSAGRGMQSVYSGPGGYRETGFAGRGPRDYQRSDERIREDICDRMTDDDSLDASDVTIQVKAGEVTLAGTVHSRAQKRRAEDLAESISGVRDVTNNIRLSRDPNEIDLQRGTSIQVGQSGKSGDSNPSSQASSARPGSKSGTSGTGAGGIS